jgi:hypothetical protein
VTTLQDKLAFYSSENLSVIHPSQPVRLRSIRLAYQSPTSSTLLSEQTNHLRINQHQRQPSEQINTSHQPNEQADKHPTATLCPNPPSHGAF